MLQPMRDIARIVFSRYGTTRAGVVGHVVHTVICFLSHLMKQRVLLGDTYFALSGLSRGLAGLSDISISWSASFYLLGVLRHGLERQRRNCPIHLILEAFTVQLRMSQLPLTPTITRLYYGAQGRKTSAAGTVPCGHNSHYPVKINCSLYA